jgi:PKHD-type hydroxylase
MNGLWCYHKQAWTPEYCSSILHRVGYNDFLHGTIDDGRVNHDIRRSKVKFIQASDQNYKDVFDRLWIMAVEANKMFFDFHLSKLDYVQIGRYDDVDKGEYTSHQDVFWMNKDPKFHRKLSCSIQLSDPRVYEGGDLRFDQLGAEEPPSDELRLQGTSIFFPSFVFHRVTPVTKGTRYSLVAWFDGPKWR